MFLFFFFKQKTAYEMRISDWSSDVCLPICHRAAQRIGDGERADDSREIEAEQHEALQADARAADAAIRDEGGDDQRIDGQPDRKSVVEGKSVSVRVDLGGRRIIKNKKHEQQTQECKEHTEHKNNII